MKKKLIIVLFIVGQYALSIDPNLMYRLGVVVDVPVNCNPVIGLSFLKFGIIESWITSSSKDSVVRLTNRLFTLESGAVEVINISYFTPESIGRILQIIETTQDAHDKIQQALVDYCKGLPEFNDISKFSADDIELLTLISAALQYVDMNTVYPKGAVQALFLAYLCSISHTREDIQAYYRGFLNNPDFKLAESAKVPTVTTKSSKTKKEVVKDYFCSVSQTTELQKFIDSFAQKSKSYDALQDLVLLFFDYKDGNLVPNTAPSDIINYISVSHLGTMMRIIEQHNDPKVLMKKLGDYLVGLKILNRTTEEFLDEKSFNPLLVDISESVALTQGNDPKYTYEFFMSVLNSCICSRFTNKQDIKDYSEGFFVHATPDLIEQKEKDFACCIPKKHSHQDQEHEDEDHEPWELEFEHGHHHEEAYYDISDAIVRRAILLNLKKEEAENSVESIIYKLSSLAGAFYYKYYDINKKFKKPKENREKKPQNNAKDFQSNGKGRIEDPHKELVDFNRVAKKLRNLPGASYQKIGASHQFIADSRTDVIAVAVNPLIGQQNETNDRSKGVFTPDEPKQLPNRQIKSSDKKINLKGVFQIIQGAGFVPSDEPLVKKVGNEIILPTNNQEQLLVPRSLGLVCSGMQPTIGNLALGLQKVLGLKIIPEKNIHLMLDPRVAAQYFNKICRKFNWKFDLSNFDSNKPIVLEIKGTKVVIDLNMQRPMLLPLQEKSVQETKTEQQQKILISAASMKQGKNSIVPSFSQENEGSLVKESDVLQLIQNTKNSDSLVAAGIVTGAMQVQQLVKYPNFMNAAWFAGMPLILQKQRALFEFASLKIPKPYERVMSKLNEIMSNKKLIDSVLVGYELQNFFEDPSSEYRTEITVQDINDYFEYAPVENIILVVNEINKLTASQRYDLFARDNFSKQSLASLFERVPIEDLMLLFNYMKPQQKEGILKKLSQDSLKKFVNDLSMQEFYELFQGINNEQMRQLKISATENVLDTLYQRIEFYSQPVQQLSEHSSYLTMSELKDMEANQLEELALQRKNAYEEWYTKFGNSREIQPTSSEIRPIEVPTSRKHFIPTVRTPTTVPINYRRYLRPESWRSYIAEHGRDIAERTVRDVVRSGIHGLK